MNAKFPVEGGCLCGAVRFELRGGLRPVIACHCGQCRKWCGHFGSATAVRLQNFSLTRQDGLKWFRSSNDARRGFCRECGGSLFFAPDNAGHISIFVGALDNNKTGLKTVSHIFVNDKPDYYEISDSDSTAKHPAGGAGVEIP